MNNKKTFSLSMFIQTYKQLKTIGIAATGVLLVINILPLIFSAVRTEAMYKMYADNPKYMASMSPEVVNIMDNHGFTCIAFMVFAPIFAFNVWKFLNKRNTSDFYHSLPYTRECLFLSKAGAVIVWLLEIFVVCYIGTSVTYLFCKKYFIVDYGTLFSVFLAMFIASILVFAAISLACAVTGNAFSNVVVSGLIIFLPRFMISIISDSIESMTYIVSADKAISFLNDTQNIVTTFTFGFFRFDTDYQMLMLSAVPKIYTLILALIYLGAALVLFKIRNSECAGKASDGKGVGFVIKFIICTVVASAGTIAAVVGMYTSVEESELEMYSYIMSAAFMFFIAAMVVIIYEFFSNRHFFKFKSCILPVVAGWLAALLIAVGIQVGANAILDYTPEKEDIDYVIVSKQDSYWYDSAEKEYYNEIEKTTPIDNVAIKQMIAEALKFNADKAKNNNMEQFWYGSDIYYDKSDSNGQSYVLYDVYIKDGLFGKYRTIYLTDAQEKLLINNIQSVQAYRDAYYDLPDYEHISLDIMSHTGVTDEDKKKLYDTYISEIKSIDFETYYKIVHGDYRYNNSITMTGTFARKGIVYVADFYFDQVNLPKTYAKYIEISNACVDNQYADVKSEMLKYMGELAKGEYSKDKEKDFYITFADIEGNIGHMSVSEVIESEYLMNNFMPVLMDKVKRGEKYDASKKNTYTVELYYGQQDGWNYINIPYYVQIDKNIDLSDYIYEY